MKTWKQNAFFGIVAIIVLAFAFTACFSSWEGEDANLTINFGNNNGRSVQWPPYDGNNFSYNMKFIVTLESKSGIITDEKSFNAGDPISNAHFSFTVSPGSWKIDIKIYLEENFLYATFSDNIYITAGKNLITAKMKKAYSETDCIHQWGDWTVTLAATCTAAGEEERVCALDQTHIETRPIAINPNAHQWGNWTVTTPATCMEAAVETRVCALNSNHIETQTGAAALEHDWGVWILTDDTEETKTCTRCGTTETRVKSYNLGDTGPGGGIIFYVSENGFTMTDNEQLCHYLEAAPADMTGTFAWASGGYESDDIAGTGTAIGTGRKNTALILAIDANAPAAKACYEYSINGKTDWFLPSKDELNALYDNRTLVDNMSNSLNVVYWSSLQYDRDDSAWGRNFGSGGQGETYKYRDNSVRAVRAF